jgi:hypothetical protein
MYHHHHHYTNKDYAFRQKEYGYMTLVERKANVDFVLGMLAIKLFV